MNDSLDSILSELQTDVDEIHAKTEKHGRKKVTISIVLLLGVICYMSVMKYMTSQIDTNLVAQKLQEMLAEKLPDIGSQMRNDLKNNAPHHSQNLVDLITKKSPVEIRVMGEKATSDLIAQGASKFQQDLELILIHAIDRQLDILDSNNPELSNIEKIDAILGELTANFQALTLEMVDSMYSNYAHRLREIDSYLARLQVNHNLTPKQDLHRKIIITWVHLLEVKGSTLNLIPNINLRDVGLPTLDLFTTIQ